MGVLFTPCTSLFVLLTSLSITGSTVLKAAPMVAFEVLTCDIDETNATLGGLAFAEGSLAAGNLSSMLLRMERLRRIPVYES